MIHKNKIIGIVYKITNKINNKSYIGCTTKELNKRISQHKSHAKIRSKYPLHMAIKKHGFENFEIDILEKNISIAEMYQKEIEYISLFDATNSSKGYNASKGGESGNFGRTGWCLGLTKNTDERVKKIAEKQTLNNSFKGKTHSLETKEKWKISRSGKNSHRYGKPNAILSEINKNKIWTEEQKMKISNANSKPILCLENNKVYPSCKMASIELEIGIDTIRDIVKGKRKNSKNSFIYVKKGE